MSGKDMSRVLIVGHYGSGNFGDDAMLAQLLDEYRSNNVVVKVVFFLSHSDYFDIDKKSKIFINRTKLTSMLLGWVNAVRTTDTIVWGGGTCFTDEEGDGFFWGMLIAKLFQKKVIYRSIGIGKLTRKSRILKAKILLKMADSLNFRDKFSLERAVSFNGDGKNMTIEKDLGEVYLERRKFLISSADRCVNYILLAWRDLFAYSKGSFVGEIGDFVYKKHLMYGYTVYLLDTDNVVDLEVNNSLEQLFLEKYGLRVNRFKNCSLNRKCELINNAKMIVTARLHVGVAAYIYGVDFFVYPYSPKINYEFDEKINKSNYIYF